MTENTEFVQSLYGNADSGTVLVQMVDDHDLAFIEKEIVHIEELTGSKDFLLAAIKVKNWNTDLSPWPAPLRHSNISQNSFFPLLAEAPRPVTEASFWEATPLPDFSPYGPPIRPDSFQAWRRLHRPYGFPAFAVMYRKTGFRQKQYI